jgi:hypothetical protein
MFALKDLVGPVEPSTPNDVTTHRLDRLAESEFFAEVEAVIESEELEDIQVRAMRRDGRRADPSAATKRAPSVFEPLDRAWLGQRVIGDARQSRIYANCERMNGRSFPRHVRILHDEHEFNSCIRY